jgi:hypothetical protein
MINREAAAGRGRACSGAPYFENEVSTDRRAPQTRQGAVMADFLPMAIIPGSRGAVPGWNLSQIKKGRAFARPDGNKSRLPFK